MSEIEKLLERYEALLGERRLAELELRREKTTTCQAAVWQIDDAIAVVQARLGAQQAVWLDEASEMLGLMVQELRAIRYFLQPDRETESAPQPHNHDRLCAVCARDTTFIRCQVCGRHICGHCIRYGGPGVGPVCPDCEPLQECESRLKLEASGIVCQSCGKPALRWIITQHGGLICGDCAEVQPGGAAIARLAFGESAESERARIAAELRRKLEESTGGERWETAI